MNQSQLSLFEPAALAPDGLQYWPEFISGSEERALLQRISELDLRAFQFGAFEGKRRVASFGAAYDFTRQRLEPAASAPPWLDDYTRRIERLALSGNQKIAQILVTEYQPGAGIGWHRDKQPFDMIFGLSLAATCPLRLRRKHRHGWERFTLTLEPRSLYLMRNEVRQSWEHSIPPMADLRYSITFRTLAPA
jgi:alkylated DNA repair dioxygenase AlkB